MKVVRVAFLIFLEHAFAFLRMILRVTVLGYIDAVFLTPYPITRQFPTNSKETLKKTQSSDFPGVCVGRPIQDRISLPSRQI